jgi:signal transduction histidine kinase
VRLEVADTGVGMDEETQRRIFTPFFTTKGARGTGLGLTVVASILRERGGSIDLRSAAGQGTRVLLEMPVAGEAAP